MTLGLIISDKTFFLKSYISNQVTINFSFQIKPPVCKVGKHQNRTLSNCLVVFGSEGRVINLHIVHIILFLSPSLDTLAGRERRALQEPLSN